MIEQAEAEWIEWLERFLDEALPDVLQRCEEGKQTLVADLIRLVELDRKLSPPPPRQPPVVEWVEWDDVHGQDSRN
jgi:hypothetical protein